MKRFRRFAFPAIVCALVVATVLAFQGAGQTPDALVTSANAPTGVASTPQSQQGGATGEASSPVAETVTAGDATTSGDAAGTTGQAVASEQAVATSNVGTSPEPAITTASDGTQYASHQVVVSVDSATSQAALDASLQQQGVAVDSVSLVADDLTPGQTLVLVEYSSAQDPAELSSQLVSAGIATESEPNYVFTLCEEEGVTAPAPADPEAADSSATTELSAGKSQSAGTAGTTLSGSAANDDASASALAAKTDDALLAAQWNLTVANAFTAWDVAQTDGAVTVVTIDSGVEYAHPDLANNLVLADYAKNTYSEEYGADAVADDNNHGTHVAGIIAAQANNAIGVAGVSYNAKVLPIKATFDSNKLYSVDIIEGINYVVELKESAETDELSNIRVINMSLTGTTTSSSYEQAVAKATSAGILVVAAAGNRTSSTATNTTTYPAAYSGVVGVSALMQSGTSATFDTSYSNYGSFVDIAAPGTSIFSTLPDDTYGTMSGTSMATPMVSGAAALLFSLDMDATPAEIESALESSATDMGDAGRDDYYGYGALDIGAAAGQFAFSQATIGPIADQKYTGSAIKPAITVTLDAKQLVEGTDYEVSYKDNIKAGTATVIITGMGNYSGTKTANFTIEDGSSDPGGNPISLSATSPAVAKGEKATVAATLEGVDSATFRFYYSTDGSTWKQVDKNTTGTTQITATATNASRQWKVVATTADGRTTEASFAITILAPTVTAAVAPGAGYGQKATVTVATADYGAYGPAKYKYYYSADNGLNWKQVAYNRQYAATDSVQVTANGTNAKRLWKVVVTFRDGRTAEATFVVSYTK